MLKTKHARRLAKLGACEEATAFVDRFSSMQKAWDRCEVGPWMLWLFDRSPANTYFTTVEHIALNASNGVHMENGAFGRGSACHEIDVEHVGKIHICEVAQAHMIRFMHPVVPDIYAMEGS